MHSCLTLVDYTWLDCNDDSDHCSSASRELGVAFRGRRTTRSLDSCLLPRSSSSGQSQNRRAALRERLNCCRDTEESPPGLRSSLLLLTNRQPPIYAAYRRKLRGPSRLWVPHGHCRYLLDRNARTGEIPWSLDQNDAVCTPRSLAEICIARMVVDWPCMLPQRQPSLRNVASFLFTSRDLHPPSARVPPQRLASPHSQREPELREHLRASSPGRPREETARPSMTYHDLPDNVITMLLSEAILQRDCAAIAGLLANWPMPQLTVRRLIPPEEFPLAANYLTKPSFVLVSPEAGQHNRTTLVKGPSLLDAFMLGLLTRQPPCKLTSIDFVGFEDDRRVSIELSRLPILWMKPENRNSESVRRHLMASLNIGIPRKRLEAYFARIACIYAIHEAELGHGETFETVIIHLDCNMTVDEVALGLSLQTLTPFRFSCNRLLLQRLPEIHFPPYNLIRLFNPLSITQFEMEDPTMGSSLAVVLPSAVGWLISLRNLRACSLPACIPPPPDFVRLAQSAPIAPRSQTFMAPLAPVNQHHISGPPSTSGNTISPHAHPMNSPAFTSTSAACRLLNRALISLRHLQRLGLARCHLTGQLKILLNGLSQPLEYLNLQDCCLSPEDLHYLVFQWRPFQGLYELNLSRNDLSGIPASTLHRLVQTTCLRPAGQLVCLSLAYTCLPIDRLIWLVGLMIGVDDDDQSTAGQQTDAEPTEELLVDKYTTSAACTLHVLCLQPFVPPTRHQTHRLLHRVARLCRLQRFHLFPAAYAFPAHGETGQRELRAYWLVHSKNYLRQRCRSDIEVL